MKKKVKSWLRRYLPAEVFATFTAILSATITFIITKNYLATAFAGTWGENIGYYGYLSINDIRISRKKHIMNNKRYNYISFLKNIRNLFLEFGVSEILDSFLVRPFTMYIFPLILGNLQIGILVGKISADIIFYIPTIVGYELRKKHFKD